MIRSSIVGLVALLALSVAPPAQDPARDPGASGGGLLRAQGEYTGTFEGMNIGVQLIALTGGEDGRERLRLVRYSGGLPGAGWQRGGVKEEVEAVFEDGRATFRHTWIATLADGVLTLRGNDGESHCELRKVERKSPTLGARPPKGAVVLFDGSSADAFVDGRMTEGGHLAVGCDSKRGFLDHRIHLEFKTPFQPAQRGQGRGNSGVYVQGRYECQILDSFGLDGRNNECGGIYSIARPIVNACLPPATWQTYDIVFTAARYDGPTKSRDARMTVHLNRILVHDDVVLPRVTGASRRPEGPEPGGLYLQDHGNPVVYRNIWIAERDLSRTRKIVFLPGRRSHGYGSHEHKAGCILLATALEASGLDVETEVIEVWPDDAAVLENADVIVSFADGGRHHPLLRHLGALDALMARGVGLVCLHYAVEVPKGVPGDHFLDWIGGYFETHRSVNPTWTASFAALPDHPTARGVQPFAIRDEWYFHMRFRPGMESVTPILSAVAPASTMTRKDGPHSGNPAVRAAVAAGEPQPVAWARVRPDGGRGFGFTGAHVHWNWAHDDFRTVALNAIVWCAQLEVPADGVSSATPTLAMLQQNQDFEPGRNFDRDAVLRLVESFRRD